MVLSSNSEAIQKKKAEVDVLEVTGTAATVRVVLENWHGMSFTDYHSLVKIDGKWQIVSKVFHQ